MEDKLFCKICGQSRKLGRKLCNKCNSKRIAEANLKRRGTPRYNFTLQCTACAMVYTASRKSQKFCANCWRRRRVLVSENKARAQYVYITAANRASSENAWEHRRLAELLLCRKLTVHEVVHHIDGNPRNNILDNLIVMNRSLHGKLHKYLDDQRVILEKSGFENLGNCWNNLITPMTTAWLETTGAKVIKLSKFGQSAAEPLESGEGSETSAPGTLTDRAEGGDTVQTTTR